MSSVTDAEFERLGAEYRHAVESVPAHLRKQATAEIAWATWLRDHPAATPDDPELAALTAAMRQAEADVAWCRALVIACGEAFKGCRFEDVPDGQRPTPSEVLARIGA